jgi:2-C-methyl-D-erythritol 2,4-cyclodiphosphate synthase
VTRVGLGFDVHPLVEGRTLVLGGVEIPAERGLDGHSDADVLTHAVADALLGALALGDLGQHFPDSDPRYRGISSLRLLSEVAERVRSLGGLVVNVDATIVAEGPRLAGWLDPMRTRLAGTLGLALDRVSVKAKRAERLGALGRHEGIAAMAVALVEVAG